MTDALRLYVFMLEHKALVVEYTRALMTEDLSTEERMVFHRAIRDKLKLYELHELSVSRLVNLVFDEVRREFNGHAP